MNVRDRATERRDLMLSAVLLAGLLDFSANWLAAHYLVPNGFGLLVPAGTFCFAIGVTIWDYLRRWHGLLPTLAAVVLGFSASVVYSALFGGGVGRIAVAGFAERWHARVLAGLPRAPDAYAYQRPLFSDL